MTATNLRSARLTLCFLRKTACAVYVELNPIRAAMARTPEKSVFTSIQRRIEAVKQDAAASVPDT